MRNLVTILRGTLVHCLYTELSNYSDLRFLCDKIIPDTDEEYDILI